MDQVKEQGEELNMLKTMVQDKEKLFFQVSSSDDLGVGVDPNNILIDGGAPNFPHGVGASPKFPHGIRARSIEEKTILYREEPSKAVFKLEKGSDYYPWQYGMMKYFEGEGLTKYVDGTLRRPEMRGVPGTQEFKNSEEAYLKWAKRNLTAERAILACVGKSQISMLSRCTDAREMWTRLRDTYMQKDDANILRLEKELQTITWSNGTSLEQYIQRFDDIVDQLRLCGQEVPERQMKLCLLEGIPEKYDNLKEILLHDKGQSYLEMCASLRSHHGLRMEKGSTKSTSTSAFLGERRDKYKRNNPRRSSFPPCTHCGRKNHESDDCYFKISGNFHSKTCYNCGKTGHFYKICPNGDARFKGGKNVAMTSNSKHEFKRSRPPKKPSHKKAHVAYGSANEDKWIVDSGASQHMCNNKKLFQDFNKYKKREGIYLGDSSEIRTNGIGSVDLELTRPNMPSQICNVQNVLHVPGLSKNLLFVTSCISNGIDVKFYSKTKTCVIKKGQKLLGVARLRQGLWELECKFNKGNSINANIVETKDKDLRHGKVQILRKGEAKKGEAHAMPRKPPMKRASREEKSTLDKLREPRKAVQFCTFFATLEKDAKTIERDFKTHKSVKWRNPTKGERAQ